MGTARMLLQGSDDPCPHAVAIMEAILGREQGRTGSICLQEAIYRGRRQIPVEDSRIFHPKNRGFPGVGLKSKKWKQVKDKTAGTVEQTVEDNTQAAERPAMSGLKENLTAERLYPSLHSLIS